MIVNRLDFYRDGGTAIIETDEGNFYLDKRIRICTNKLYDAYPNYAEAKEVTKVSVRKKVANAVRDYKGTVGKITSSLADEIEKI